MSRHDFERTAGHRAEAPAAAVWIGKAAAAVYLWLEAIGRQRGERALREFTERKARQAVSSGPIRG